MKQIVITHSFQKNLKKLRRHFTEQDVQNNIKEFVRIGLRKGESKLKTETFGNVTIVIVKLRIRVHRRNSLSERPSLNHSKKSSSVRSKKCR